MDIEIFEDRLSEIWDAAIDIDDTLWYSYNETLFDAIITEIEDIINDR